MNSQASALNPSAAQSTLELNRLQDDTTGFTIRVRDLAAKAELKEVFNLVNQKIIGRSSHGSSRDVEWDRSLHNILKHPHINADHAQLGAIFNLIVSNGCLDKVDSLSCFLLADVILRSRSRGLANAVYQTLQSQSKNMDMDGAYALVIACSHVLRPGVSHFEFVDLHSSDEISTIRNLYLLSTKCLSTVDDVHEAMYIFVRLWTRCLPEWKCLASLSVLELCVRSIISHLGHLNDLNLLETHSKTLRRLMLPLPSLNAILDAEYLAVVSRNASDVHSALNHAAVKTANALVHDYRRNPLAQHSFLQANIVDYLIGTSHLPSSDWHTLGSLLGAVAWMQRQGYIMQSVQYQNLLGKLVDPSMSSEGMCGSRGFHAWEICRKMLISKMIVPKHSFLAVFDAITLEPVLQYDRNICKYVERAMLGQYTGKLYRHDMETIQRTLSAFYACDLVEEVASHFKDLRNAGFIPTRAMYLELIGSALRRSTEENDPCFVEFVVKDLRFTMERDNHELCQETVELLLRCCLVSKDYQSAIDIYNHMVLSGLRRTPAIDEILREMSATLRTNEFFQ